MVEYKKYISALRQCAKEHEEDITPTFQIRVTDLCSDTADLLEKLETDTVERAKIDTAVERIKGLSVHANKIQVLKILQECKCIGE